MIDYISIGRRIRYYRQKSQLTQEQLAEAINVSMPHMSRIEGGKTKPSLQVLVDISNSLSVTIDQLLCDSLEKADISALIPLNDLLADCTRAEIEMLTNTTRIVLESARKTYKR